jgi:hypothetical protein
MTTLVRDYGHGRAQFVGAAGTGTAPAGDEKLDGPQLVGGQHCGGGQHCVCGRSHQRSHIRQQPVLMSKPNANSDTSNFFPSIDLLLGTLRARFIHLPAWKDGPIASFYFFVKSACRPADNSQFLSISAFMDPRQCHKIRKSIGQTAPSPTIPLRIQP